MPRWFEIQCEVKKKLNSPRSSPLDRMEQAYISYFIFSLDGWLDFYTYVVNTVGWQNIGRVVFRDASSFVVINYSEKGLTHDLVKSVDETVTNCS